MKNRIILLILILLTSSCSAKEMKVQEKPKDFSYLKIQTVLSEEDKKYYETVHNQISEIGKHFALMNFSSKGKNCSRLDQMIKEISIRPYSRERERERERELALLSDQCGRYYLSGIEKHFPNPSCSEVEYLNKKILDSAVLIELMKNCLIKTNTENAKNPKAFFEKIRGYTVLAQSVDDKDLSPFRYETDVRKEYCKRAVEQKQWDHISYLVQLDSGVHSLTRCLDPSNPDHRDCVCPQAVILFVKEVPKKHLLDRSSLDPSDVESNLTISVNKLIKVIKEATGRDLDKEPEPNYPRTQCSN